MLGKIHFSHCLLVPGWLLRIIYALAYKWHHSERLLWPPKTIFRRLSQHSVVHSVVHFSISPSLLVLPQGGEWRKLGSSFKSKDGDFYFNISSRKKRTQDVKAKIIHICFITTRICCQISRTTSFSSGLGLGIP